MAFHPARHDLASSLYVGAVVVVTGGLYGASCCLPATSVMGGPAHAWGDGFGHVLFGCLGGLRSLPAWSANFVLPIGIVLFLVHCFRAATVLGTLATLLALTTLTSFKHDALYVDYYLWQSSHVILALGAAGAWLWLEPRPVTKVSAKG